MKGERDFGSRDGSRRHVRGLSHGQYCRVLLNNWLEQIARAGSFKRFFDEWSPQVDSSQIVPMEPRQRITPMTFTLGQIHHQTSKGITG